MRTPASIAGHPVHPMLITFPIGLLVFSLICDLISLRGANLETWATVALYTMVGGFIGANRNKEREGDHREQRVVMEAPPRTALEVIKPKLLLHLLMAQLA